MKMTEKEYELKIRSLEDEILDLKDKLCIKEGFVCDLLQWIGLSYYKWLRQFIKQGSWEYSRVNKYIDCYDSHCDKYADMLIEREKMKNRA